MRRARSGLCRAALVAAALGLLACPAQQGGPPPSEPPPVAPGWSEGSGEGAADLSAVEPGFTPCCGSARYRMEIECGEMLKRCYEYKNGGWKQTYGRHCKEQLGESCYLEDCDSKCQ